MTSRRPAVFVDRDNTLIPDPGYLRDPQQVRLLPGTADAIRRLRNAGWPVIVITNQSGVARGLLTENDVAAIHERMNELLQAEGARVDAIYYCPFLDSAEAICADYRKDSDLRKPKPGMLLLAAREHGLDLARSWMIGDGERDVQAGKSAGCQTILLSNQKPALSVADHVAADLPAAADLILQTDRSSPVSTVSTSAPGQSADPHQPRSRHSPSGDSEPA